MAKSMENKKLIFRYRYNVMVLHLCADDLFEKYGLPHHSPDLLLELFFNSCIENSS